MEQTNVIACFERANAILRNDHFIYASWMHGSEYVSKKMLYTDTLVTRFLCYEMARRALTFSPITCVVGPEKGGIILSQLVGYFLSVESFKRRVTSVYAEKIEDIVSHTHGTLFPPIWGKRFVFSDEYKDLVQGKDIVLVDDVVNTGGSLRDLARLVRKCGGKIRGAVTLWNRGDATAENIEVPSLLSLVDVKMESWSAEQCQLCKENKPVNPRHGRGREFIIRQLGENSAEGIARFPIELPPYALRDYRGVVE